MKCLAGESAGSFVVEGIAEQRMADVSHVDADLVGAAGFEIEFEVGENGAVREGAVMGYGALAGGKVDGLTVNVLFAKEYRVYPGLGVFTRILVVLIILLNVADLKSIISESFI